MNPAALTNAEQRRLARLAEAARIAPKAMLRHVLRDGFDYCEYVVGAANEGLAEAHAGELLTVTEVRRQARESLSRHATHKVA